MANEVIYDLTKGWVPENTAPRVCPPFEPLLAPQPPVAGTGEVQGAAGQQVAGTVPAWVKPRQVNGEYVTGRPPKYPFRTLPVGGTFQVPPGAGQPKWVSFQETCRARGKSYGKRFLCHRYPDGTFEVWRES